MKNQHPETPVPELLQSSPEQPQTPQQPLIGEAEPTQINMWKNRFRRIYGIIVPDGDEQHVGYFRRPDMDVLAAANRLRKEDQIKAVNVLFENCWLGGSEVMRNDAIVKMGAMARFNTALSVQQAEIKNL